MELVKMDENSVNVKCDFCGNDMECPKDMLSKAKKHMCYKCLLQNLKTGNPEELKDIHIDFPKEKVQEDMINGMVDEIVEKLFPDFWAENKDDLKGLSKKELALEAFDAGVFMALSGFISFENEQPETKNSDSKPFNFAE